MGIGVEFVAIAFWVFVAVAVISGDIRSTKRRQADLELIRFAIEKGQPLSPALVEQILARGMTGLYVGGITTIAAGVGLIVFSLFLSRISTHGGWAVAGGGGIAICVGIGLVVSYRLTRRPAPQVAPA